MPKLSDQELSDFLAEPGHMLRLATVDDGGMPRLSPVWFLHQGDEILFTPRAHSVFRDNLMRDPRVALSIDEAALPYRKVNVQAEARLVHDLGEDDVWRDTYRTIACRYISEDAADRYISDTIDQPRALFAVPLTTVTSWRMPLEGEASTGIWAKRYYGKSTVMAKRAEATS